MTYRLEETSGEVFVNGEVALLLLSQARLNGRLLDDSISTMSTVTGHGPVARHREDLTVAALNAAAMGRLRASLNMMIQEEEEGRGEDERREGREWTGEAAPEVGYSDRENSFLLFLGMALRRGRTGCCSQPAPVPG